MNEVMSKIFRIDIRYILKNYTNKKLWKATWNLFKYDGCEVYLSMTSIVVSEMAVKFKIRVTNDEGDDETSDHFIVSMNEIDNLIPAMNRLFSTVLTCMERLERYKIRQTENYQDLINKEYEEEEELREIANEFLDEEGVTHGDIRYAYIENYVSNNSTSYVGRYVASRQYTILHHKMLTFFSLHGSDNFYNRVKENVIVSGTRVKDIEKEISKYLEELNSENRIEEMKNKLENI